MTAILRPAVVDRIQRAKWLSVYRPLTKCDLRGTYARHLALRLVHLAGHTLGTSACPTPTVEVRP